MSEKFKIDDKVRFLPCSGPDMVGKTGTVSYQPERLKKRKKGLVNVTLTTQCYGFSSQLSIWVDPEDIEHCPEDGLDKHGLTWEGERCKSKECNGKRITQSFDVNDEVWEKVTEGKINILCHPCFDVMAQRKGISYTAKLLSPVAFTRTGETWEYGGLKPGRAESTVLCECGEGMAFVWDTNAEQGIEDATCPQCDMLWRAPTRPESQGSNDMSLPNC